MSAYAHVTGRVATTPEVHTEGKAPYARFRFAVPRPYVNKTTGRPDTDFWTVIVRFQLVSVVQQYVCTGRQLHLRGFVERRPLASNPRDFDLVLYAEGLEFADPRPAHLKEEGLE